MPHPAATARRMFELVEPIHTVLYFCDEPNEAMAALGLPTYWDGYFAGRAGPLGVEVPAEVVDAIFYNFAPGEVARHIPSVWSLTTPSAAAAARLRGCGAALHRILGEAADSPELIRAADLLTRVAQAAPVHGRPIFAGLLSLPVPAEPLARLWHAATMLREHRGDGHNAALLAHGVGRTDCHVLLALGDGMPAHQFGRVHHLPRPQLDAVIDGMKERGLVGPDGWLTDLGRDTKQRVEDLTDQLAAPAYAVLDDADLARLIADLEPITAAITAVASFDS